MSDLQNLRPAEALYLVRPKVEAWDAMAVSLANLFYHEVVALAQSRHVDPMVKTPVVRMVPGRLFQTTPLRDFESCLIRPLLKGAKGLFFSQLAEQAWKNGEGLKYRRMVGKSDAFLPISGLAEALGALGLKKNYPKGNGSLKSQVLVEDLHFRQEFPNLVKHKPLEAIQVLDGMQGRWLVLDHSGDFRLELSAMKELGNQLDSMAKLQPQALSGLGLNYDPGKRLESKRLDLTIRLKRIIGKKLRNIYEEEHDSSTTDMAMGMLIDLG